jgi:hypothetical protein
MNFAPEALVHRFTAFLGTILAASLVLIPAPPQATAAGSCPHYGPVHVAGSVRIVGIREISGAVAGRRRHVLWLEQDSGNPARVYAIAPDGRRLANIRIANAHNRDWEDIAYANGRIWIGDIGGRRNVLQVYRFREPRLSRRSIRAQRATLRYANGATHNAEAMFVDGTRHRLYVVTKERSSWQGFVYRANVAGLRNGAARVLRRIGRVTIGNVTAADLGPKGFVVRNLSGVGQFYRWRGRRNVAAALRGTPCRVTVARGESIAFTWWNPRRLYTVPEGTHPPVRFVNRV